MKWDKFRRSESVEDYRDPQKPVMPTEPDFESINEILKVNNSELAKDIGADDVKRS